MANIAIVLRYDDVGDDLNFDSFIVDTDKINKEGKAFAAISEACKSDIKEASCNFDDWENELAGTVENIKRGLFLSLPA